MRYQKHEYYGPEGFSQWLKDADVEGGSVSPGGASQMLHMSRAGVMVAIDRGDLEAWVQYAYEGGRAQYVAVSVRSIKKYTTPPKTGRPPKRKVVDNRLTY